MRSSTETQTLPANADGKQRRREQHEKTDEPDDFEAWYLRAVTEQYANDLDKVRQAPDFKDSSVSILVKALRQGAEIYGKRDRDVVMGGGL